MIKCLFCGREWSITLDPHRRCTCHDTPERKVWEAKLEAMAGGSSKE